MALFDRTYPPALADDWDAVGLICGEAEAPVRTILLAVDPTAETVAEALEIGADMLITHHPLYLRGTTTVAATSAKGRWITDLIRAGCALFNAHTNADSAAGGVADALAEAAGLDHSQVLVPAAGTDETVGLGRIGCLDQPMTLRALGERLAENIPASAPGILVAGPQDAVVQKIAVSGGSGDSFLANAREAGADVYVSADLRHHPANEHLFDGTPYLIGLTHWASEWVWLPRAKALLEQTAAAEDIRLEVVISTIVTDPWSFRIDQPAFGKD